MKSIRRIALTALIGLCGVPAAFAEHGKPITQDHTVQTIAAPIVKPYLPATAPAFLPADFASIVVVTHARQIAGIRPLSFALVLTSAPQRSTVTLTPSPATHERLWRMCASNDGYTKLPNTGASALSLHRDPGRLG